MSSGAAAPDGAAPANALDLAAAEPLLRRLELQVRNRLDGLLQGNYLGLIPGPGSEAGDSRLYVPGDDVRRMDWPVTARTMEPHIRQTIADRELETWLAVDLSPSLDFGTVRSEKRELVLAGITAVVHLTARTGNRVGAVVTNGESTFRVPALGGIAHARYLIERIAATPRATSAERGDLGRLLDRLSRPPKRRGLVAVISDFLGDLDWERPLRGLAARHQLLAIEIVDPRELQLPAAGLITLTDPETGQQVEVQTANSEIRERFARAAAEQRAQIAAGLRHAGAAHLQLRTDQDWLSAVTRFVLAQRRATSGAGRRAAAVEGR